MKYLKIILLLMTFSTTTMVISSCGSNSTKTEQQGKEYTSAYVCPMHCEGSGSDKEGRCPVCLKTELNISYHKNSFSNICNKNNFSNICNGFFLKFKSKDIHYSFNNFFKTNH